MREFISEGLRSAEAGWVKSDRGNIEHAYQLRELHSEAGLHERDMHA
jgi:hypothetical protein